MSVSERLGVKRSQGRPCQPPTSASAFAAADEAKSMKRIGGVVGDKLALAMDRRTMTGLKLMVVVVSQGSGSSCEWRDDWY
jgi:hypothetical protein